MFDHREDSDMSHNRSVAQEFEEGSFQSESQVYDDLGLSDNSTEDPELNPNGYGVCEELEAENDFTDQTQISEGVEDYLQNKFGSDFNGDVFEYRADNEEILRYEAHQGTDTRMIHHIHSQLDGSSELLPSSGSNCDVVVETGPNYMAVEVSRSGDSEEGMVEAIDTVTEFAKFFN